MQNKDSQIISSTENTTAELLQWTTHPIKTRPLAAVLVSAFILFIPFLVLSLTSSKIFGFLSLAVLFASVAKFYFPTYFTLTDNEAIIKSSTQTIKKNGQSFVHTILTKTECFFLRL